MIQHIPLVFLHFLAMTKKWILDYLCSGKGVIPYEKKKSDEDLDCVPDGDFFRIT